MADWADVLGGVGWVGVEVEADEVAEVEWGGGDGILVVLLEVRNDVPAQGREAEGRERVGDGVGSEGVRGSAFAVCALVMCSASVICGCTESQLCQPC